MTQGGSTEIGGISQDRDLAGAAERITAPVVRLVDAARRGRGPVRSRSCGVATVPAGAALPFSPADVTAANDNSGGGPLCAVWSRDDDRSVTIAAPQRRCRALWPGYATVGLCALMSAALAVWMAAFLG